MTGPSSYLPGLTEERIREERTMLLSLATRLFPSVIQVDRELLGKGQWCIVMGLPTGETKWLIQGMDLMSFGHLKIEPRDAVDGVPMKLHDLSPLLVPEASDQAPACLRPADDGEG